MTMVERVAVAICRALGDDPDREGERLTAYDDAARAAIEAMRDPTPEMLEAGGRKGGFDGYWVEDNTAAIWAAMIDTALDMPVRGDLSPAERDLGGEG